MKTFDEMIAMTIKELENVPTESYRGILISPHWDNPRSFKWMCENARFVFTHKSSHGERLKIVLREPVNGFDCFEIGNDRFGVVIKADTRFTSALGGMIEDSSKNIVPTIKAYFIRSMAFDLIIE